MSKQLVIDGSFGEGGGQILRTSLSLAALTGTSIRIENIRAGRKNPGLQPQHLTSARAVTKICNSRLSGDKVGSTTLEFEPGGIRPGSYTFDVSEIKASAGAVSLIFQTVFWPLIFASKSSTLTLKGGTHVPWSPSANYVEDVFLPTVARMDVLGMYTVESAGYYPIGGGVVRADIQNTDSLQPIDLEKRGKLESVYCYSSVSNLSIDIARRQLDRGLSRLEELGVAASGEMNELPSPGKGTVFFILAKTETAYAGFTGLGERGKPAEKVAEEAVDEFEKWYSSSMSIDPHLADQLVIPMALADGVSSFTTSEITLHLMTNLAIVEKFLSVKFDVYGNQGEQGAVRIVGAGSNTGF